MNDNIIAGFFISGVIGVILFIIVTILSATCGKELYLFDSSRWATDWDKSNVCSKVKFLLYWIGLGLVGIPFILLLGGALFEYIQFKRM